MHSIRAYLEIPVLDLLLHRKPSPSGDMGGIFCTILTWHLSLSPCARGMRGGAGGGTLKNQPVESSLSIIFESRSFFSLGARRGDSGIMIVM